MGHEDWVTSVHWMVKDSTEDSDQTVRAADGGVATKEESHRLYSTSMDRYINSFFYRIFVCHVQYNLKTVIEVCPPKETGIRPACALAHNF